MEKIVETRLGSQKISMDKVVHFPRGLIGFESEHEFTLLQMREDLPFLMLQSTKSPNVGLLVTDPYTFYPEYLIEIKHCPKVLCLKLQFRKLKRQKLLSHLKNNLLLCFRKLQKLKLKNRRHLRPNRMHRKDNHRV